MNLIGRRVVRIETMILPNDFPERMKTENVKAIAQSVADDFLFNEPIVRQSDMQVVMGVDRIAAHRTNNIEEIEVKIIECTDKELEKYREAENFARRGSGSKKERSAAIERLVKLQKEIEAERKKAEEEGKAEKKKRGPGRPKGAAAKVAKQTGIPQRTVQRAVSKKKAKPKPPVQQRARPPIDTLGIEMTPARVDAIREVSDAFDSIDHYMRDAKSLLSRLGKMALPVDPVVLAQLEEQITATQYLFQRSAPKSICLYCKERPDLVAECTACNGSAYSTADTYEHAPKDLRKPDKVSVDGKVQPYHQVDPDANLFSD